jgi:threonine dehydrogenase-like Zn-dependent dehydrogenase
MEQLFFIEPGRVEWRDIPSPKLADDKDALVRPVAVATCDLDTALVHGAAPFAGPFSLGHEGVGEVVEIGSGVTAVTVGQRVIVPFQVSCGTCARCRRGLTGSCESVPFGAMYGLEPFGGPWGGFLCGVIRVPWADHMLIPLPEGVDPVAAASLSDNIPDAWRAVVPFIGDAAATSLLVVGGGAPSIPFYAIAIAKALGVQHIDYLEFAEQGGHAEPPGGRTGRAEKAARAGADIINSPDDVTPRRYTITVCSASDVGALNIALRATEPDGTCVVNAIFFQDDLPLPMLSMYTYGVHLVTGRVNARSVLPNALGLIVEGTFRPETITDTIVAWPDAADALIAEPQKLVIRR